MTVYDQSFYATGRAGAGSSADVIIPLVLQHISARTVVDVGCGEGWFGKAFEDVGCEVLGLDGDYAKPVVFNFKAVDLEQILPPVGTFDLAVCLEVAEHLSPNRALSFVFELTQLADVVLFSAAIPGQGGTNHINEQWPAYWVDHFTRQDYTCSGALRWAIWDDDRVENWYRQNLIVAARHPERYPDLFDTPLAPVWPVVHPVLYDARR